MDYDKIADPIEIKPVISLDCKMEQTTGTYKLFAIVHHFGTKGNGHYITEALDLSNNSGTNSSPSAAPIGSRGGNRGGEE